VKIHHAKKLCIVSPDHPEHTILTVIEREALETRMLTYEPGDLEKHIDTT
jgi:hypothetical protein